MKKVGSVLVVICSILSLEIVGSGLGLYHHTSGSYTDGGVFWGEKHSWGTVEDFEKVGKYKKVCASFKGWPDSSRSEDCTNENRNVHADRGRGFWTETAVSWYAVW
ncbi:MAG: hypothetical protein LBH37_00740 [Oscillospiraceae bacterium]|nr:hypothetical protein [Oscillospiraceae bacterium]